VNQPTRIVVIDAHPIFRQGVIRTIARSDCMEVLAEGTSAGDARRLASETHPDVLILDIAIAKGRAVVSDIAKQGIKCVVLTTLDDVLSVSGALASGANGYILKGVSGLELIAALKAIQRGEPYVSAELAARMLIGGSLLPKRAAKVQDALSFREQQLLDHITKGYTNQEIANKLGLTVGTTKVYLTQLFKKMRVRNRLQAVIAARNQTP
jgi:two-component system, NarL family, nitrate/nitrite response regulator NarL